ncbi:Hypothetical predicted protein [Cloeon dipterum]|nr:Hypothetical predicted protein [Cloeon dipterum]
MNVFNYLLTVESKKLLKSEEEMNILMTPALKISLRFGLKVVNLNGYLSNCPAQLKYQYFKTVVRRASEIAPNIEELILTSKQLDCNAYLDISMDSEFLQALSKFSRLHLLQIEDVCYIDGLDDLFQLLEHLQELQYLSVCFPNGFAEINFEEQNIAEKMKKSMSNLKVFRYGSATYHLRRVCMDHLPNLQVIEDFASDFSLMQDFVAFAQDPISHGTSNLRHLLVDYSQQEAINQNYHLTCPLVSHMAIFWWEEWVSEHDCSKWKPLLKFTQIESLHFLDTPLRVLNCFLSNYGSNLREISIRYGLDFTAQIISLKEIFAVCPNLEKLKCYTTMIERVPFTSFACLKEVNIEFMRTPESSDDGLLSHILSAPGLTKVTLVGNFEGNSIKKLTSLISKKKILLQLESLTIEMRINNSDRLNIMEERVKETMKLTKCATANLQKLSHVKFYLNFRRTEYSVLARSLRDGKISNESMPDITIFYSDLNNNDDNKDRISWFVDEELISILDNY